MRLACSKPLQRQQPQHHQASQMASCYYDPNFQPLDLRLKALNLSSSPKNCVTFAVAAQQQQPQQQQQQQHLHLQAADSVPLAATSGNAVAAGKANCPPSYKRRAHSAEPHAEKVLQRYKANRKERRRTQSINLAFNKLRNRIPDVPLDTKLSKIRTLRLAINYINYLVSLLAAGGSTWPPADAAADDGGEAKYVPVDALLASNTLTAEHHVHQHQPVPESHCGALYQNTTAVAHRQTRLEIVASPSGECVMRQMAASSPQLPELMSLGDDMAKVHIHATPPASGAGVVGPKSKHRTGWPEIIWRGTGGSCPTTIDVKFPRHGCDKVLPSADSVGGHTLADASDQFVVGHVVREFTR